MTKYKIITSYSQEDLSIALEKFLNDEWKLQGGVAVSANASLFFQAIVKENSCLL